MEEQNNNNNKIKKVIKMVFSFNAIKIGFIIIIAIIIFSIISGSSLSIILKDDTADKTLTQDEKKDLEEWLTKDDRKDVEGWLEDED